ncbi:MAG: hypothetical protein LH702_24710 [Phormidesmis sp. CAN_BIN44]|nr:hypothetical protein [Phormidesmis sp. CAN_BIN44]
MSRPMSAISQEELLLQTLTALIRGRVRHEATQYSGTLEDCLTELVRVKLRSLAATGDQDRRLTGLLEQAIRVVEEQLLERFRQHDLPPFDLEPYLKSVQVALKFPGQEIQGMQERLRQAQQQEQVRPRRLVEAETAVPFEIIELGLQQGQLQGLVAKPLVPQCDLNLEWVRQEFEIEGEWFPYALFIEEFVFLLNAEGILTLDTGSLTSGKVDQAYGAIEQLARQLYTRSEHWIASE